MTDSPTETRCPACRTVFAVEAEDLARANGKVRCGECMHVFDALAHATRPVEPKTGSGDEPEARDEATPNDGSPPDRTDDAHDGTTNEDFAADIAEDIDDAQFTATNWFIVDEAGDLAPIDARTNDAEAGEAPESGTDDGELLFGSELSTSDDELEALIATHAEEPAPDDSGAFRFGDDTPPDTLRAELAALVGEDVDDAAYDEQDVAANPGEAVTADADANDAEATGEAVETDIDGDWDDLLGELDEALEAADTSAGLDFELVDTDTAGNETSVDLDLTRATAETASPDFEFPDDALMSPTTTTAAISDADAQAAATLEPEPEPEPKAEAPGAAATELPDTDDDALSLEPEETPPAEAEDTPDETADAEAAIVLEAEHAAEADPAAEAESAPEDEPDIARVADDDESDDADFDHGALDDLLAAAEALDEAPTEAQEADLDTDGPEQREDDGDAADAADALELELVAEDDDGGAGVGEDTINAMAEGARGEVIVLGGEDEPAEAPDAIAEATEMVIPAPAARADAAPDDEEDDPSFAESMIISPDLAPRGPRRTGLWLSLSLVAVVVLAAQAVHAWRGTLVTRPFFENTLPPLYDALGIPLSPAWDIRQWCVETSGALQSEAGLEVESILSNRGELPMPPPVMKVRITDAYSDTLAATVIEPGDYLVAGSLPGRIAPGTRITALARLDYNEPRLDGYEVELCYAGEDGVLRCGSACPAR